MTRKFTVTYRYEQSWRNFCQDMSLDDTPKGIREYILYVLQHTKCIRVVVYDYQGGSCKCIAIGSKSIDIEFY